MTNEITPLGLMLNQGPTPCFVAAFCSTLGLSFDPGGSKQVIAQMRWIRRVDAQNNFDLVLVNPNELNLGLITELLDRIQAARHRGLTLSARADQEFRRWARCPDTPLKSDAYVLLSNWFLTLSGDRRSIVASQCEALWDLLFPCRPTKRLSSPESGRNHVMVSGEFESFWATIMNAQGERRDSHLRKPEGANVKANDKIKTLEPITNSVTWPRDTPQTTEKSTAQHGVQRPLTIAEAKAALGLTFGVSPDSIEITIRG